MVVGRLLSLASEVRPDASLRQTLQRLLDLLIELEPAAGAGVTLRISGEEELVIRRSNVDLTDQATEQQLFPELAHELHVPLSAPLQGRVHFAAASFEQASRESYVLVLSQVASVVSLVTRMLRAPTSAPEIDRASLAQLQKMASIGQSTAEIVHELNNPLTAIIAYADFLSKRLREQGVGDADLERLMRIHEAASRIQVFCRDLTDYSRVSGSLRSRVDLHGVIDRALGFCMHGLRQADITVERVYRDIPMLEGLAPSLTQVFVNLFTNACHAMDGQGGGTLSIHTRLERSRVVVTVADDGPGVAAESVFDHYFTTKPRGSGVGLGLAIVKQTIQAHGGSVRAENREPTGAVFSIELPGSI